MYSLMEGIKSQAASSTGCLTTKKQVFPLMPVAHDVNRMLIRKRSQRFLVLASLFTESNPFCLHVLHHCQHGNYDFLQTISWFICLIVISYGQARASSALGNHNGQMALRAADT